MRVWQATTFAALAVAVVAAVFAIWPAVGEAPWEDEGSVVLQEETETPPDAGPRRTALEILNAAQSMNKILADCDDAPNSALIVPWYNRQDKVWLLGCFKGDVGPGRYVCFEVDDMTLETRGFSPPPSADSRDGPSGLAPCHRYGTEND